MRISDWSSDVCSSDLNETTLFLHQRVDSLPSEIRSSVARVGRADSVFADSRLAIIDDDIRNIFSLTSVLEREKRSEERRVGTEWVSTCRARWSALHEKNNSDIPR